jgi:hypothetical protein
MHSEIIDDGAHLPATHAVSGERKSVKLSVGGEKCEAVGAGKSVKLSARGNLLGGLTHMQRSECSRILRDH